MIITDGTTTLTFDIAGNVGADNTLEASRGQTAGGRLRESVAGERFSILEKVLVDGDELKTLLSLLKSSFTQLYYTPDDIPPELSASDFPMAVNIAYRGKKQRWYNGQIEFVIDLDIKGTELIP
jgi:hypothetical protein